MAAHSGDREVEDCLFVQRCRLSMGVWVLALGATWSYVIIIY